MPDGLPSKLLTSLSDAAGIVRRHEFIHIFSHYDADGLSAAAVAAKALLREGKEFQVTIFPTLTEEYMKRIESCGSECVLVTDLGASYIRRFDAMSCDVVVLDHHTLGDMPERICYANPHIYGIDGMTSGCGATMAFLFAITLSERNWDLAPVAMVGIVGDRQHLNGMTGLNSFVMGGAKARGLIEERPGSFIPVGDLSSQLLVGTDPYIRGVSGVPEGVAKLMSDAGIAPGTDYADLSEADSVRLSSMIAVRLIAQGVSREKLEEAVRTRYFLPTWKTDAETLSSVVNACGRNGMAGVGVGACMGDPACLEQAFREDSESRSGLMEAVKAMDAGGVVQMEHIQCFDSSDSGYTGMLAGVIMSYIGDPDKPTIGINCSEQTAKVSSRATFSLLDRGVDLSDAMRRGCAEVGGEGGGHRIAAGGSIDRDRKDDFLKAVDRIIGEQLAAKKARARQVTGTSSVRYLCLTTVSSILILTPEPCMRFPSQAIMAPLSRQKLLSGTCIVAPLSRAISATMSLRRPFCATPPPSSTWSFPMWAIALSVTSVSIANAVSWTE